MTLTLTNGPTTLHPRLWSRYETARKSSAVVHDLIGGTQAVILGPAAPRRTRIRLLFDSAADAWACEQMHGDGLPLTITDPDLPHASTRYVATGDVRRTQEPDHPDVWWIEVDAAEIDDRTFDQATVWVEEDRNLHANPYLKSGATSWGGTGGVRARVASEHPAFGWAWQIEGATTTGNRIYTPIPGLTIGKTYTVTVQAYVEAEAAVSWRARITPSTTGISGVQADTPLAHDGVWRTVELTFVATAETHYLHGYLAATAAVPSVLRMTGACPSLTPGYWDGDTLGDDYTRYRWLGAQGASISVRERRVPALIGGTP